MIWLASYPRSGNTFFRNILFEIYGLKSSTFHLDPDYHLDKNYADYPFVKTHLLPDQLLPGDASIPSVYIIRDGRDALVSMAHHRKDIVAPGSDFYENLKSAIIAERGTFFGGWSKNVAAWVDRADLIIRYEDLLIDPIKEVERLRTLIDLPISDESKLPQFEKMKFGIPQYGSGKDRGYSVEKMKALAEKNFRKGKSGSWKEEMPEELHDLYWSYHGDEMDSLGYAYEGGIKPLHADLDFQIITKLGKQNSKQQAVSKKILIESNKITSGDNDGVKRYQMELLKGFLPLVENPDSAWQIDLFIHGKVFPLLQMKESILEGFSKKTLRGESGLETKKTIFEQAEQLLVKLIPDKFISFLDKNNIKFFHHSYELLKKFVFLVANMVFNFLNTTKALMYRVYHGGMSSEASSDVQIQFTHYDLIHLPLMHHYLPFQNTKTKILATVHDLTHVYFPQFHTKINISNSQKGLDFITAAKADVVAVSNSTKNDLLKECDIPPEKVHMVYEAAERQKFNYKINRDDTKQIREKYGIGGISNYIICLSTIEPRKNLENTIKGFNLLLEENPGISLNLVIAGKKGWETTKLFLSEVSGSDRVLFTGFIDDEDIAAIYSEALAMSYLSFYEGFGLPALEAMCCGTPVIYGNNSSLIEVVGPGGLACDPYDIQDIKEKLGRLYFDKKLRKQKSENALKQSLQFSWRKTVKETLNIYEKIIDKQDATY